jgi:hypothetical protein
VAAQEVRNEFSLIVQDNAATDVSGTQGTTALRDAAQALAQDVFNNALSVLRIDESLASNQKENIVAISDSLISSTNTTRDAAKSYLDTDYVAFAQEFSESNKKLGASYSVLQAGNIIASKIQGLLESLSRG